jgi:hypothetical protein
MAANVALVIAVETYQDPAVPPVPYAEADGAGFARVLSLHGFTGPNQVLLLGSQASKTAVESKLRRLLKGLGPDDTLFLSYAGHGFSQDGRNYLTCYDSQPDDLAATSIPLGDVLAGLKGCAARRVVLFLDAHGDLPAGSLPPGSSPHLAGPELNAFFAGPGGRVCFASCRPAEASWPSGRRRHGVWAYHVLEALQGKAPLALEQGRFLTAASLQEHLAREVPRTLARTFTEPRTQTPVVYGAPGPGFVVADLRDLLEPARGNADPRLQQLKRGTLRAETRLRVKGLAGFRKFHHVPDRVGPAAEKFVAEIAADDLKADVDACYTAVREHLGYKRREVEVATARGQASVRTPDFEYTVSVAQSADDPAAAVCRREIAGIRTPEVVLSKGFQAAFGAVFDTLVFEFHKPFDLETWVDRFEEEAPEGVRLRCASDCSTCEVTVAGFPGVVRLHRDRVEVQGQHASSSTGLVQAFLDFQEVFHDRRDLEALPLSAGP